MAFVFRLLFAVSVLLAAFSGVCSLREYQFGVDGELLGWISSRSRCEGTLGECSGEEFSLDSEGSRRILAGGGYISYGALRRGSVPCNRRGASYYNCRPGA